MQFIPLNQTNHDYWQTIYREAFPASEQIDFQELKQKEADHDQIKMVVLVNGEQNVGIAYFVDLKEKAFVLYLAVDQSIRGQGIGGKILSALKERYPKGIILESESTLEDADNQQQREARYHFYLKNGFIDTKKIAHNMERDFHLLTSNSDCSVADYLGSMKILGQETSVI
ncbi:GNAT family N-acetyltransferase [Fructobacillus evanidus]|uniref:Ribosomal protein S18 acetylase RimI and related acetyltransferases (RimI) n=1 Tax=Fructobacillus evanidus TaxID=3064281 RepID=A0ABN9YU62_9LACO|nr:Ribosomal protein S18 acetylase RimI and related acetyltransferases (RimI) [Fructobacillus sp. LMG 32999]CAK1229010.1 Ribosomal protein S18 acetylase RimI and related acetyltransferases (RimI) [Fructobacillus sp. LMG 32999]CAK1231852.1 Ribosomal protein S18 acetylase RimI and related acetyltransferases (RimI) [Fructobacillus sp. LMG 32999]CAK1231956.1 Ribosomal protein S18 acetylase RimI and related acetyltransferases (RimI) [Fructobacillus sp. LMG 32999]CAK1233064.1 Ribosomal protein S18 ac